MFEALDLCLECKACKTECPANVDLAKLKYEFLAHYNARHGVSLRARVFGNIALLSRIGSATAPASNWLLESSIIRHSLQGALGIHPMRKLPRFARMTFQRHLRRNPVSSKSGSSPNVVLFNDTFTNYNEPWIGIAALKLLESAGARVCVPEVVCCGRPLISKGLVDQAKENAKKNIALLAPLMDSGCVVVGCEPSCLLTLRDEYPVLVPSEEARQLAGKALLVDQYLVQQLEAGQWRPAFSRKRGPILFHGHCHQKSLVGTASSLRLLRMPGSEVSEIDSGCCGMAGSFGYEKEHYELSLGIGEMRLFPAVRKAPPEAEIVAAGISCRQQILHATGRRARHLAEVLAGALQ
jgi:Fe-S oxidoreductase